MSVCLSICPSVRLSVTQNSSTSHHRISLIFCNKSAFYESRKVTKPDFRKKMWGSKMMQSNEAIFRKWTKTANFETNWLIIWTQFFFSKIGLRHFSRLIRDYLHAKNLRNLMVRSMRTFVMDRRTDRLTELVS